MNDIFIMDNVMETLISIPNFWSQVTRSYSGMHMFIRYYDKKAVYIVIEKYFGDFNSYLLN